MQLLCLILDIIVPHMSGTTTHLNIHTMTHHKILLKTAAVARIEHGVLADLVTEWQSAAVAYLLVLHTAPAKAAAGLGLTRLSFTQM
jgi:hypothetical protein